MDIAEGPPAVSESASSSATPMATTSLVSQPQSRSTGKKASSASPPKKKEVINQDEVFYPYIGEMTPEQDNMITLLTTMTMFQEIHLNDCCSVRSHDRLRALRR
eukprot:12903297-Prorocentrum_lima.AAC.1